MLAYPGTDHWPGHQRLQKQLPHRKQTLVGNLMKNWDTIVTIRDNTRQPPFLQQAVYIEPYTEYV